MVSCVCLAQPIKPQFGNQPIVEITNGRVASFQVGTFQKLGRPTDILYINAPTGSGTFTSVLAGEELSGQGFTNLGENQIVFTNVSNVVAAVADFNGDGKQDYAFALSPTVAGGTNLCVYYGTGATIASGGSSYDGGNLPNAYPPTGGDSGCTTFATKGSALPNFAYIAAFPFSTSSAPQLIVEDSANNYLYIFANNGQTGANGVLGSFTLVNAIALPAADGAGPVYVGDFNGDGKTDFIVNGQTGNSATVYFGDGNGGVTTLTRYIFDHNVHSMLMHDMNGDGIADMVVEGDGGIIEIFKGNNTTVNTFAATPIGGTAAGLNGLSGAGGHLAVIDPNNLDILTTTPIGLSLLRNQGGSSLTYTLNAIYNIGPGRTSFALANFLSVNNLDLAVDSAEGVAVIQADANGDGGFQTSNAYSALAPALGSTVGQFRNVANNPNHHADVVVNTGAVQAQLLTGNGDGTFNTFSGVANTSGGPTLDPTLASYWSTVLSGDFNGDGIADIAYSLAGANGTVPANGAGPGVYVQDGAGNGTFQPPVAVTNTFGWTALYGQSAVGDFNGDGVADLANINPTGSAYDDTLLGQKGGGFVLGLNASTSKNPSFDQVAAGYFKMGRSSQQDLVFQAGGAELIPYLNSGDGVHFTAMTPLVFAESVSALLLTDVDGDGNGDIVALNQSISLNGNTTKQPAQLYIWYGNGDGTFQPIQILNLSRNYDLAAVADMNSDGLPDLVLSDGSVVSILYNQGNRSFGTLIPSTGWYTGEEHFLAGQGINSLSIADLNGDGKPELIVANGGATLSNAYVLSLSNHSTLNLTANPDVNTGGITVLLNKITTTPVTSSLIATPDPVAYQATFTITATLTPSAGVALPTGQVQFYIDGNPVGNAISLVPGTTSSSASYVVPAVNTYTDGLHTLMALYYGDNFNSQTTLNGTELIQGGPTTTTLYLCIGPAASCPSTGAVVPPPPPYPTSLSMYWGQTFNGIASATANDGSVLTGSIAFNDAYSGPGVAPQNPLCTLNVAMASTCPPAVGVTIGTGVGANVFTAVYSGDASHLPSTSPAVTIVVLPDITSGAPLTGSPNPSPAGQPVTFTATLTGNYAAPTGPVAFAFGSTVLCASANLVPNATGLGSTATCTTSTLPVGTDAITATYAATLDFDAATFPVFNETITPSLSGGFTIAVTPNPVTIATGYGAVLTVTVSGQNGFSQGINLACGNLPTETTCSFGTAAIAAGGGSTTLLLATSAPHSCGAAQPYFNGSNGAGPGMARIGLPALAGLLLMFIPGKRRWLRALVAALVVAGATQMTGCGNCTDLGTRPATYTFQVTGTAANGSNAVVSQPVTLNVAL